MPPTEPQHDAFQAAGTRGRGSPDLARLSRTRQRTRHDTQRFRESGSIGDRSQNHPTRTCASSRVDIPVPNISTRVGPRQTARRSDRRRPWRHEFLEPAGFLVPDALRSPASCIRFRRPRLFAAGRSRGRTRPSSSDLRPLHEQRCRFTDVFTPIPSAQFVRRPTPAPGSYVARRPEHQDAPVPDTTEARCLSTPAPHRMAARRRRRHRLQQRIHRLTDPGAAESSLSIAPAQVSAR